MATPELPTAHPLWYRILSVTTNAAQVTAASIRYALDLREKSIGRQYDLCWSIVATMPTPSLTGTVLHSTPLSRSTSPVERIVCSVYRLSAQNKRWLGIK
mmetsp:Transcript_17923/g.37713  ORF Transcript_17923/g.37713 Transcript_17923/m.37713 type:complete len:100 (+) Transcript_17923:156-455(+)